MSVSQIFLRPQNPQKAFEVHRSSTITSGVRIPALDGLRGMAILMVLVCHAVSGWQPTSRLAAYLLIPTRIAWSGVDLFFVLSGFLIGGILLDAKKSPRYYSTFYLRRAFRILPIYVLVLALFLVWVRLGAPAGSARTLPWYSYATFTQNLWMAILGTFGVNALSVTWSLAVEEQFYLTVPVVIRKFTQTHLCIFLVVIIAAAPAIRSVLYVKFSQGALASYVLTPCRADALSMGVMCAIIVRNYKAWNWIRLHRNVLTLVTLCLFFGVVELMHLGGYEFSQYMVTVGYTWLALFYTGCLLLAVTATAGWLKRFLELRVLIWLGAISYCAYLIHVPIIEIFHHLLGVQLISAVGAILATSLLASISWKFFEGPLLRRGHVYRY